MSWENPSEQWYPRRLGSTLNFATNYIDKPSISLKLPQFQLLNVETELFGIKYMIFNVVLLKLSLSGFCMCKRMEEKPHIRREAISIREIRIKVLL